MSVIAYTERTVDLRPAIDRFWEAHGLAKATWREKADAIGISQPVIHDYMTNPKKGLNLKTAERIIEAIGGDLRRALPGYDSTPEFAALKKERDRLEEATLKYNASLSDQWIGEVCAGPGRVVLHEEEEGAPPPSQSALERIARTHRHYKLGTGPIVLLAVRGESMEPEYPEGCTVLARQIDAPDDVPNHADVLLYDRGHDVTLFRRLFLQRGKPIIAAPLNFLYEPDYFKPDDVILTHIVVGKITT